MPRLYEPDGTVTIWTDWIPDDARVFVRRVYANDGDFSLRSDVPIPSFEERAYRRRRYRIPAGYSGPVRDDDWHHSDCPCAGCEFAAGAARRLAFG